MLGISVLLLQRLRNSIARCNALLVLLHVSIAAKLRNQRHFHTLGLEPRDLIRSADKMLFELSQKIGPIPGTDLWFFPTNPTDNPGYEAAMDIVAPRRDQPPSFWARRARHLIDLGAAVLPG